MRASPAKDSRLFLAADDMRGGAERKDAQAG
jgi:hypothetical protein